MTGESIANLIALLHKKKAPALIQARGKSMSPFIKDGDILTITPKKEEEPLLGDVVAFLKTNSKELIVHRIVGRSGSLFIVKGDNVFGKPDVISVSDIIGVVTDLERRSSTHQWIGLGPEKKIIGLLSRLKLLNIFLFIFYFFKNLLQWLKEHVRN